MSVELAKEDENDFKYQIVINGIPVTSSNQVYDMIKKQKPISMEAVSGDQRFEVVYSNSRINTLQYKIIIYNVLTQDMKMILNIKLSVIFQYFLVIKEQVALTVEDFVVGD